MDASLISPLKSSKRHQESHFTSNDIVRDIILGLSDGLTVPFALVAGLSNTSPSLIVTAGLAEVVGGAIAMGLGGYLAAKSDIEHYGREKKREEQEVQSMPNDEAEEVTEILRKYGLEPLESKPLVDALRKRPNDWVEFMMRFELGLEKPNPKRALNSALTIAISYVIGGLMPLLPYMMFEDTQFSFLVSTGLTLCSLSGFGYVKGKLFGTSPIKNAIQTTLIGAIASTSAFLISRAIQSHQG